MDINITGLSLTSSLFTLKVKTILACGYQYSSSILNTLFTFKVKTTNVQTYNKSTYIKLKET